MENDPKPYKFMKESIKKQPPDWKKIVLLIAGWLVLAALGGLVAAAVFAVTEPKIAGAITKEEPPAKVEDVYKRQGLDYWPKLDVTVYESYEDFLERNPGAKIYYATTKGPQTYVDVHYEEDCFIMFGKESAGIPEDILYDNQETAVRIPMINDIRSLNLSNSVAIVLYEALRQNNFGHMQLAGHLRTHEWR